MAVVEEALSALFKALRTTLVGSGQNIWGTRAHPDQAPQSTPKPYVLFFYMAGGEVNWVKGRDAEIVIGVKCVADKLADAMLGAAQITAALNDMGQQDVASGYMSASPDWKILTTTKGLSIHLVENFENAQQIYHEGAQYRFHMEP